MNKLWFCGMSGPNSLENLQELLGPIATYFDGIVWVLHDSVGSDEEAYLESIKGEGKVIHYYFNKRHNESRNQYLWCGPIKQGDWICQCDDLERINPNFIKYLRQFINEIGAQGINALFYYNKPFIFEYHESMRFDGNPHEGLNRLDGQLKAIEYSHYEPVEDKVRYNVRSQKRQDPYHWVNHYAKYLLYPWGSNHALLGASDRGNEIEIFRKRDALRLEFIQLMRDRKFDISIEGLTKMLSGAIDDKIKFYLNCEKVWQDFYRYNILGDKTVVDEHKWTSMIKI